MKFKYFDKNTSIVESKYFLIYNDKLEIKNVFDFSITIDFITDSTQNPGVQSTGGSDTISIRAVNFDHALGTTTDDLLPLINFNQGEHIGKTLYCALHASKSGKIRKVLISFYIK